jgi:hypothetical protein
MRNRTLAVAIAGMFLTLAWASFASAQQNSRVDRLSLGTIRIEYSNPDSGSNTVGWDGPYDSRLYIQVDGEPQELFASGGPGTQVVSWFTEGHLYRFTLVDVDGNILATNELDLRGQISM